MAGSVTASAAVSSSLAASAFEAPDLVGLRGGVAVDRYAKG